MTPGMGAPDAYTVVTDGIRLIDRGEASDRGRHAAVESRVIEDPNCHSRQLKIRCAVPMIATSMNRFMVLSSFMR